jgi:hypothetical protein
LDHLFSIILINNICQESEEEVTDTEQAENWFSLTSAQRICAMLAGTPFSSTFNLIKESVLVNVGFLSMAVMQQTILTQFSHLV